MKVLLIHPPVREEVPPTMFPLGMAYIVTCLKKANHKPIILDFDAKRMSYEESWKIIKNLILKGDIGAIGTGGLVTVYNYCKRLVRDIRAINPNIPIIVGGSLSSSAPEVVMEEIKPDYLVMGEAEISFVNLINCLEKEEDPKLVKGIAFEENKKVIFTPKEDPASIEFLNNLLPDWDEFDVGKYMKYPNMECGKKRSMSICSSRGCPFNCRYCYHIFGRKTRMRSPESIVNEMKLLKKKFNVNHIVFSDDLFTVNRKRTEGFCELLKKEKLKMTWSVSARVDTIDLDSLEIMKKAGCNAIGYGFESGSQKILDLMNKRTKVEQARKAIRMTRKAGIFALEAFMIGFPGETKETFEETVKFCIDNNLTTYFSFTCPYPGTEIYHTCNIEKKIGLKRFLEILGEQTLLNFNLTNMRDEELKQMCDEGEKRIARAFILKNYPYNIFLSPLILLGVKKYASGIKEAQAWGFWMFLKVNLFYQYHSFKKKFLKS